MLLATGLAPPFHRRANWQRPSELFFYLWQLTAGARIIFISLSQRKLTAPQARFFIFISLSQRKARRRRDFFSFLAHLQRFFYTLTIHSGPWDFFLIVNPKLWQFTAALEIIFLIFHNWQLPRKFFISFVRVVPVQYKESEEWTFRDSTPTKPWRPVGGY